MGRVRVEASTTMYKLHVHDGLLCRSDDCAYAKGAAVRRRKTTFLLIAVFVYSASFSAAALAADRAYGLLFLAVFLIVAGMLCGALLRARAKGD